MFPFENSQPPFTNVEDILIYAHSYSRCGWPNRRLVSCLLPGYYTKCYYYWYRYHSIGILNTTIILLIYTAAPTVLRPCASTVATAVSDRRYSRIRLWTHPTKRHPVLCRYLELFHSLAPNPAGLLTFVPRGSDASHAPAHVAGRSREGGRRDPSLVPTGPCT